jgi:hypothetical protein
MQFFAKLMQSYAPLVFLKTIFLVVAWGLLHGLILLPAFLSSLPDCLTETNCYHVFMPNSSQKSCLSSEPSSEEQEMDAL